MAHRTFGARCLAALAAAGLALVLFAAPAAAAPAGPGSAVDWSRYADEDTVTVVTTREDGSRRETTVWLVVVDGHGILRTGATRWGADVERDPEVLLRVGETELPLRAVFVEDEAEQARAHEAFRAKYGWMDRTLAFLRFGEVKVMRLVPRAEAGE